MGKENVVNIFDEMEKVLKAQIVGGPGSNPLEGKGSAMTNQGKDWAGSSQTDLEFPNTTPNGTDWKPKSGDSTTHSTGRGNTRKSVKDFSEAELARELEFRKSGVPNPTKADQEIMTTVGGVTKAVCPTCDGNALMKGQYCQSCNNLGHIYSVETNEAASMIKGIQQKWNVDKIDADFWKSQNVNTGGGVDEADTTPKNLTNERGEKEDHTGEMVAKGDVMAEECDDAAGEVEKRMSNSWSVKKGKGKKKGFDFGGDEEAEEGGDFGGGEEGGEEEFDMEKCGKALRILGQSNVLLLKAVAFLGRQNVSLQKALYFTGQMSKSNAIQLDEMSQDTTWLTQNFYEVQQGMNKSLSAGNQPQQNNAPARGPNAVGPGVQLNVMQKSFVDSAPGGQGQQQQQYQGGSDEGSLQHSYTPGQLKKAASYMTIKRMMPVRAGLSLETGAPLDENVEKALVKFLDKHEGNVPALDLD